MEWRLAAFDAEELRQRITQVVRDLVAERALPTPSARRSLEAQALDEVEGLDEALEALGVAADALRTGDDASRFGAWRTWVMDFVRMVTSSSAAVGCTAMVASKSALVARIRTAIPINWIISPASGPTIWAPTTRSVRPSTTSFMNVRVSRPDSVAFIGRNMVL